jgi:hypothetical protein
LWYVLRILRTLHCQLILFMKPYYLIFIYSVIYCFSRLLLHFCPYIPLERRRKCEQFSLLLTVDDQLADLETRPTTEFISQVRIGAAAVVLFFIFLFFYFFHLLTILDEKIKIFNPLFSSAENLTEMLCDTDPPQL